ncbi:MAG TPA: polyamine aminopropyltransferase [Thermotogota bacterium]|nr:polyamine aminopropyltransferase [Thermotogota bacterium]
MDPKELSHLRFEETFQGGHAGVFFSVSRVLFSEQTPFQRIDILQTPYLGRVFALDGITQTVDAFEFMYHEMLVHVALFAHPCPRKVLVIGGGDGGTLREVLKHPSVQEAWLVEIDEKVVQAAREWLPKLSSSFSDPRSKILFRDGAQLVGEFPNTFDAILIDSTDPTAGEGGTLFTPEFYKNCLQALTPQGFLVAQTEDPVFDRSWLEMAFSRIHSVFPQTMLYTGFSPQYPSGFWTYTIASKQLDPRQIRSNVSAAHMKLQYYNPALHLASFCLPTFLQQILEKLR